MLIWGRCNNPNNQYSNCTGFTATAEKTRDAMASLSVLMT